MVLRCVGSRVSSRMIISKRDNHGFAVLSRKESSLPSLREPLRSPRLRPTSTHPSPSTSSPFEERTRALRICFHSYEKQGRSVARPHSVATEQGRHLRFRPPMMKSCVALEKSERREGFTRRRWPECFRSRRGPCAQSSSRGALLP